MVRFGPSARMTRNYYIYDS